MSGSVPFWLWGLLAMLAAGLGIGLFLTFRRKAASSEAEPPVRPDLLSRIIGLMEKEKFYLRKGLRIVDVAAELGTNSTYVSACLNGQLGKSFTDFVAEYRVRHAQELILRHPDLSVGQVAEESGFPSERSFFRSFKSLTGKTPAQWRSGA